MSATRWIAFDDEMPKPPYDPNDPDSTHGTILVTNNLNARNRSGKMSHVWLTGLVFRHDKELRHGLMVEAYAGEVTCYAEPDWNSRIRNLTHWRPAVPEEWPEFAPLIRGRIRHYHGSPLEDGSINPYCPYSGVLHHQEGDEKVNWREDIWRFLADLPEGSTVSISVQATTSDTNPEDVWELLKPHTYGPRRGSSERGDGAS